MNWWQAAITLLSGAGMAWFYFRMDVSRKSPRRSIRADGKEFQMPDMRFHYTGEALAEAFTQAGEAGRPLMRRYWRLDFGFIVSFLGVMVMIAFNLTGGQGWLFGVMGVLAGLRAVLDGGENGLLLRALRRYPTGGVREGNLAGYVTSAKFLCLYGWGGLLFYRLFFTPFGIQG